MRPVLDSIGRLDVAVLPAIWEKCGSIAVAALQRTVHAGCKLIACTAMGPVLCSQVVADTGFAEDGRKWEQRRRSSPLALCRLGPIPGLGRLSCPGTMRVVSKSRRADVQSLRLMGAIAKSRNALL